MSNVISSEQVTDSLQRRLDAYASRPRQLARWLLISRDQVKAKCRAAKVELNRVKVRVANVSKSRDRWRAKAEAAQQELVAMKVEVERLTAMIDRAPPQKSEPQPSLVISIPPGSPINEPPSSIRPATQRALIAPGCHQEIHLSVWRVIHSAYRRSIMCWDPYWAAACQSFLQLTSA